MVKPVKFSLHNAMPVMVQPQVAMRGIGVLGKVYKTCIAMFNDIIHQFLQYPEN